MLGSTYRFVSAAVAATSSRADAGFTAQASPVSFSDHLTLALHQPTAGLLTLTLRDAVGWLVRKTATTVPAGTSAIALPETTSLLAGVYLLTVRQGSSTQVIRVAHE